MSAWGERQCRHNSRPQSGENYKKRHPPGLSRRKTGSNRSYQKRPVRIRIVLIFRGGGAGEYTTLTFALQSAKIAFTGTARGEGEISIVNLEPGVSQVIKSFLADKGIQQPIRIDIHFSGCCDASLGLCMDTVLETDLTLELDGLTFAISPETYQLAGEVIISYVDEIGRKGFVLTSSKPISEWGGFGVSDIKT